MCNLTLKRWGESIHCLHSLIPPQCHGDWSLFQLHWAKVVYPLDWMPVSHSAHLLGFECEAFFAVRRHLNMLFINYVIYL